MVSNISGLLAIGPFSRLDSPHVGALSPRSVDWSAVDDVDPFDPPTSLEPSDRRKCHRLGLKS